MVWRSECRYYSTLGVWHGDCVGFMLEGSMFRVVSLRVQEVRVSGLMPWDPLVCLLESKCLKRHHCFVYFHEPRALLHVGFA